MNYFFAGLIMGLWYFILLKSGWNKNFRASVNVGTMEFVILGAIYGVPFWLIFLR